MYNIGILTFYDTTNYGALFQMYALEKQIMKTNFQGEVSVIRYNCQEVERREKISITNSKSLKELIKNCLLYKSNKEKHDKFKLFCKKNIKFSKNIYDSQKLDRLGKEYDAIIVGSDQVWNATLTGNDFGFYLPDCYGIRKYSYAASFGNNSISLETREKIGNYLQDFRMVSTREKDGTEIVKELGMPCKTVLDPTFFMSKDEWVEISEKCRVTKKYILMYLIQDRKKTFEYAKKIAKEKDYLIKYINISPRYEAGVENIRAASPSEFMGLLLNAELVITGSYHGVALSINLQKDFICELNHGVVQFNSRIQNLLEELNLKERIISYDNFYLDNINYESVNVKLEKLRMDSEVYLQSIVGDMYE